MSQNISSTSNQFGMLSKVGIAQNGRVVYKVTSPLGQDVKMVSVSTKDCDTFEKSYNDIIEAAPKMQAAAEKFSDPEKMKKMQKRAKWITGIGAAIGFLSPMPLTRKMNFKGSFFVQLLISLVGGVAGLIGGSALAQILTLPPGTRKFTKATHTLSKMDIQPYNEKV